MSAGSAGDDEPIRRGHPASGTGLPDEPAWSTWLGATHGPAPVPSWVVTDLGALDTEFGVLKTGKEADVHLVERAVPGGPSCLLAAKRYRSTQHRLFTLARDGLAHGDLSPYNALVHDGRLVLIDLPQVVDVVANPQGPAFLTRDVSVMAAWFAARGVEADAPRLTEDLLRVAGMR